MKIDEDNKLKQLQRKQVGNTEISPLSDVQRRNCFVKFGTIIFVNNQLKRKCMK